jgi:hypothetical protein
MLAEQATTTWLDVTNAVLGVAMGAMILAVAVAALWDLFARWRKRSGATEPSADRGDESGARVAGSTARRDPGLTLSPPRPIGDPRLT